MTADEMWNAYMESIRISVLKGACVQDDVHLDGASYEAWAFCGGGEAGDRLAALVLEGIKTATSSAQGRGVQRDSLWRWTGRMRAAYNEGVRCPLQGC